uniref:Uncharacterized protein n=1 Tax=Timema monikensis TaxID=170555 RepID=A0A7R9EBE5_9NEOP|nr:unnamed protein product [Timema monikensis]
MVLPASPGQWPGEGGLERMYPVADVVILLATSSVLRREATEVHPRHARVLRGSAMLLNGFVVVQGQFIGARHLGPLQPPLTDCTPGRQVEQTGCNSPTSLILRIQLGVEEVLEERLVLLVDERCRHFYLACRPVGLRCKVCDTSVQGKGGGGHSSGTYYRDSMTGRHPIRRKTRALTDCCCCWGPATWVELFDAVRRRRGRSAAARGDTSEEDEDLGLPRSPCNSPTTADVLLEKGGLKPETTWVHVGVSPFKDSSPRSNARTRFPVDLYSQNDDLIARTCLNDGCRVSCRVIIIISKLVSGSMGKKIVQEPPPRDKYTVIATRTRLCRAYHALASSYCTCVSFFGTSTSTLSQKIIIQLAPLCGHLDPPLGKEDGTRRDIFETIADGRDGLPSRR